jgi:hypothetical protein
MEMMDLFDYGFYEREIAEMYDTKLTIVHSIRRRYRNERSKLKRKK